MSKEILATLQTPNIVEGREKRLSFGVALVIVGIDPSRNGENILEPMLWTIRERKSKPGTERREGQISFPAETKKDGEELIPNMLGALSEFVDASGKMMDNLFLIQGLSFMEGKISTRGNPADLVILIYEGQLDKLIEPVDHSEVTPNGWMTIEDLRKADQNKIRAFTKDVLGFEESEGLISKVVAAYFRDPMERLPLRSMLPEDFSIKGFHDHREKFPDFLVVPKS